MSPPALETEQHALSKALPLEKLMVKAYKSASVAVKAYAAAPEPSS